MSACRLWQPSSYESHPAYCCLWFPIYYSLHSSSCGRISVLQLHALSLQKGSVHPAISVFQLWQLFRYTAFQTLQQWYGTGLQLWQHLNISVVTVVWSWQLFSSSSLAVHYHSTLPPVIPLYQSWESSLLRKPFDLLDSRVSRHNAFFFFHRCTPPAVSLFKQFGCSSLPEFWVHYQYPSLIVFQFSGYGSLIGF